MKTGIQVSSFKPLLTTASGFRAACAQMAARGWDTVQLQWIGRAVPIPEIASALKQQGIASVSVQDFFERVQADFEYYVNLNAATGGRWLCVSRIPQGLQSPEGLDIFIRELEKMQEKLTPLGQELCLHPVTADYRAVPGMDAVEYLLEKMPRLPLCLDLYHLSRCCGDMPAFLRRYAGRICMVHFKDSIGATLVPAGQGEVNWAGVVDACLEAGVPYGFAEQETWEGDPYDCLQQAMDWLAGQL